MTKDLRERNSVISIKPYDYPICARPHLGKYINCMTIDDENWLICGGGPRLAMVIKYLQSYFDYFGNKILFLKWHLRSMKPMSVTEFEDDLFVPNVCRINDNQV